MTTAIIAALGTIITAVLTTCLPVIVSKQSKHMKQHEDNECLLKKVQDDIEKSIAMQELSHEALKSVLRGNIVRLHATYVPLGEIPKIIYDQCADYFDEYERLGGNGLTKKMFYDIKQLPFSK